MKDIDVTPHQVTTIRHHIENARFVLVVVSRPIDPDCVGTGLAVVWWLEKLGKEAHIVSFFPIPDSMRTFPDIATITVEQVETFDFDRWDATVLVDGSSWSQFFGSRWEEVLRGIDCKKILAIDHHEPDDISAALPDRCLNRKTSSTAQLFYESFLSSFHIALPARVAEYLYRGLIYDTRNFRNELHEGMYRFADELIRLGAEHEPAVETVYDMREFDFFVWALSRTEYISELEATLLVITAQDGSELEKRLGQAWAEFDSIYKEVFLRQVAGYAYGLILTESGDGTVKLSWRTRSSGNRISIARCARAAGFHAGGHYNAGGGVFHGALVEAREKLLAMIRAELAQHLPR